MYQRKDILLRISNIERYLIFSLLQNVYERVSLWKCPVLFWPLSPEDFKTVLTIDFDELKIKMKWAIFKDSPFNFIIDEIYLPASTVASDGHKVEYSNNQECKAKLSVFTFVNNMCRESEIELSYNFAWIWI